MGWQPIDTAPKDGTVFVALTPRGACRCKWDITDWSDHPRGPVYHWWMNPDDIFWFADEDKPTHWIPLPGSPLFASQQTRVIRWTKPYHGIEYDADLPRTHQITLQTFATHCGVELLHLKGLRPFTDSRTATGTREECISIAEGWHSTIVPKEVE